MPEADYRYYHPDNADARGSGRSEEHQARLDASRILFSDSVLPVDAAGQVELWSDDYRVSDSLRLRPAPGHTPGSSVLWLDGGSPAVFVGDLTHSPMQLHLPADSCVLDEDFTEAAVTRRRVLAEASKQRATAIPAHYPGTAGRAWSHTMMRSGLATGSISAPTNWQKSAVCDPPLSWAESLLHCR